MTWFNNPLKKLQKTYEAKLKEAMQAQRRGDIQAYAALNQEAEALLVRLKEQSS